jgi:ubiquinone/menaquinone biosynthesis C-methylase UbiE
MYTVGMRFVVPSIVVSQFHLREGDVVADFGAGSGFFIDILSKSVGPAGRVYALDIQKMLVEKIGAMVQTQGLLNVDTRWCDFEAAEGSRLKADELDAAVVVNTLFQVENKLAFLIEIHRTLRSGGKLLIIDWTDTETGMGPNAEHLVTSADCTDLCESHGFVLDREFPAGEHHYGLAFRKP